MPLSLNPSLMLGFLLSVVLSIQASGQQDSSDALKLRLGTGGGINVVDAYYSPDYSRLGIVVGGILELKFSDIFLQIEPRYIQKGQWLVRLDYAEIPILLKWYFTETAFSPVFLLGGSVGILLSAKREFEDGALPEGEHRITDLRDLYKSFDASLDLGGGFEYRLSPNMSLLVSGRYSYGVYNLSAGSDEITSRGIHILIGALFDL
jgi:hypothetical protein